MSLRDSLDLIRVVRPEAGQAGLENEILHERASSLRAAEQKAIAALAAWRGAVEADRLEPLKLARYAVWAYFVQRELIGFRRHADVIRDLDIPAIVLNGLGEAPPSPVPAPALMRAILFDVDGVIVHSLFHADPNRRRRWDAHLLEDMGVDPEAFSALFDTRFGPTITGKVSLVETLDALLPEIGYRGATMDFVAYWMERDVNLNYQLFEGIKRLRAGGGVKLYVATNQEHLRAHYLWSDLSLGHVFDDIFYAARIGAAKPDPRFFAWINDRLGPQDEKPLFFDDNPTVVDAARRAGWDGVTFTGAEAFVDHPWVSQRLTSG